MVVTCKACGESKPHKARGLCGTCWARVSREGRLAEYVGRRGKGRGKHPQGVQEGAGTPAAAAIEPGLPQEGAVLYLAFAGDDLTLFDRLATEAKHWRRTPEQQTLWYLENALGEPEVQP